MYEQYRLPVLVDVEQFGGQRVAAVVALTLACIEVNLHPTSVEVPTTIGESGGCVRSEPIRLGPLLMAKTCI